MGKIGKPASPCSKLRLLCCEFWVKELGAVGFEVSSGSRVQGLLFEKIEVEPELPCFPTVSGAWGESLAQKPTVWSS